MRIDGKWVENTGTSANGPSERVERRGGSLRSHSTLVDLKSSRVAAAVEGRWREKHKIYLKN